MFDDFILALEAFDNHIDEEAEVALEGIFRPSTKDEKVKRMDSGFWETRKMFVGTIHIPNSKWIDNFIANTTKGPKGFIQDHAKFVAKYAPKLKSAEPLIDKMCDAVIDGKDKELIDKLFGDIKSIYQELGLMNRVDGEGAKSTEIVEYTESEKQQLRKILEIVKSLYDGHGKRVEEYSNKLYKLSMIDKYKRSKDYSRAKISFVLSEYSLFIKDITIKITNLTR